MISLVTKSKIDKNIKSTKTSVIRGENTQRTGI